MNNIKPDKKDALNDEIFTTIIYLKEDFKNKQTVPTYKITAPDGHAALFRHNLSDNCKDMIMWQHCGCTIERIMETREVNGCNIDGVQLTHPDTRELVFTTTGKASATEKYMKVKQGLLNMEIPIHINRHECKPYAPKKRIDDCHNGTILDQGYDKQ